MAPDGTPTRPRPDPVAPAVARRGGSGRDDEPFREASREPPRAPAARPGASSSRAAGAPAGPAPTGGTDVPGPAAIELSLWEILSILRRRARELALVVAAVLALCVAAVGLVSPRFTATALILVDPTQKTLLALPASAADRPGGVDSARVDSEVEIARARSTLLAAIDLAGLTDDPEFGAVSRPVAGPVAGPVAWLRAALGWPEPPADIEARRNATLQRLVRAVDIRRRGLTHVFAISATASDPARAARVANALARAYIESQIASRTRAVEAARDLLRDQLERARQRLAEANDALDRFVEASVERLASVSANPELVRLRDELAALRARRAALAGTAAAQAGRTQEAEGDGTESAPDLRAALAAIEAGGGLGAAAPPGADPLQAELAEIAAREEALSRALRRAALEEELSPETLSRLYALQQEAEVSRSQYAALLSRQRDLEAQAPLQVADARVVSEALPPAAPSFPDIPLVLSVGLFLGGGLGLGVALLKELYLGGVHSSEQLEHVLRRPVVAAIPRVRSTQGFASPADMVVALPVSAYAEAIRRLRFGIERCLHPGGARGRVVLIGSTRAGEGKSTTALALARSAAQVGRRVALIDADLRRPSLHDLAGLSLPCGLPDFLSDPEAVSPGCGFCVADPLSSATLVLGRPYWEGPTDRLLMSPAFGALLDNLRAVNDLVIVDAPPLLGPVDGQLLAQWADLAVLVTRHGQTPQREIRLARRRLEESLGPSRPLVAVLNQDTTGPESRGAADDYYTA